MEKIRIVLADDHKLFRDGIRALLEKYDDMEVVGEADNGKNLIKIAKEQKPDIILADLTMPEMSGIEAIPELKSTLPSTHIIVLTMHEDGNYITKSIQAGASAYLFKNVDELELIEAVRKVDAGEKYYNKRASELMIESLSKQGEPDANLTRREKEILQMVAKGLSTKMIAEKLFLSARTVETHRVNIMKKLHVQNSAELVKKAIDLDLID